MFAAMSGVKNLSRAKSIYRDMRKATMSPIYFNVKFVSDDSIESITSDLSILPPIPYILQARQGRVLYCRTWNKKNDRRCEVQLASIQILSALRYQLFYPGNLIMMGVFDCLFLRHFKLACTLIVIRVSKR